MILIFETGNTSTTVVVRDDDNIKFVYKILDNQIKTEQELNGVLNNLFELNNINVKNINIALISSVVRKIEIIEEQYCKINNIKCFNIKDKNIKLNFKKEKEQGTDLIANIFNCIDIYKENFIIIDMGTATTFSVVGNNGIFKGVTFIAGVKTILTSLSTKCDLLPKISLQKTESVIGHSTEEAMISGIYYGYLGILKEIVSEIKKELQNPDLKVIMTGGYSNIFIDKLDFVTKFIPELTIDGIYKIYKYNTK